MRHSVEESYLIPQNLWTAETGAVRRPVPYIPRQISPHELVLRQQTSPESTGLTSWHILMHTCNKPDNFWGKLNLFPLAQQLCSCIEEQQHTAILQCCEQLNSPLARKPGDYFSLYYKSNGSIGCKIRAKQYDFN